MKVTDIISDLRYYEQSIGISMKDLNNLYSENKAFGYNDERLDKTIEAAEDIVKRLKELKEFRDMDLVKEETGA